VFLDLNDKKIAVIGFGLSGKAVTNFLLKKKVSITVFDEKNQINAGQEIKEFEKRGVKFEFGRFDFQKIACCDLIIMSPGISAFKYPEFNNLKQNGKEVISEIELASRFLKGKLISITGTNGKSTTTTLIYHLFKTAVNKGCLVGNIGIPFISEVENIGKDDYAVVEVSCFQLEEIKLFKPNYAILTNITEDHLDRYPSMEAYIETRKNIFKNMTVDDKIILNFDDPLTQIHIVPSLAKFSNIYWFSRITEVSRGIFLKGNKITFRNGARNGERDVSFFDISDFPLIGHHNIENALAASLTLALEGIEMALIQKGLRDFKGLEHRMEFAANVGEVDFINDSKATNIDSVLKAISSLNSKSKIVIIMGGKYKGGDFSLLKQVITDNIKSIVVIGEAATLIESQLRDVVTIRRAVDMKEAVSVSFEDAKPRGTVLLSPGCASFDMFNSFEHRGKIFKEEVMNIKKQHERDIRKT
jgi:UDP-N-acetylmuramoylalanine--D-glutamate ligase